MVSLRGLLAEHLVEPLRLARGAPDAIARGAALGVWVALTPTVGIQMFVVGMLGIPLRANIPVAVALVWISNPVTMVPLYFLYYWLGTRVLAEPGLTYAVLSDRVDTSYRMARGEGLWAGLADLFSSLGSEVVWPMAIGSFIVATAFAVLAYHGVLLYARRRPAGTPEGVRDVQSTPGPPTAVRTPGPSSEPGPAPESPAATAAPDRPPAPPQATPAEPPP